jgi:hypothetical protein
VNAFEWFIADDYDPYLGPWHDRDVDAPPELEDADWAMSMYDPNEGFIDV